MAKFFLISECIFIFFNIIAVNVSQNVQGSGKVAATPSNVVDKNESHFVEESFNRRIIDDHIGLRDSLTTGHELASDDLHLELIKVNKCCPWGTFFDIDALVCAKTLDSSNITDLTDQEIFEMKKEFVKSRIRDYKDVNLYDFHTRVPVCNGTKVLISQVTTDFTCDHDGVRFEGKTITDEYCIDGRNGQGMVLSMCREAEEVCHNRPCIRKCHPFGQFYGIEDEGILDLPRLDVEFYNLDTLEVDNLVKLSHFGLYFGNDCKGMAKHRLVPEEDAGDMHYLGTDGRLLFTFPTKEYYTQDMFCVDYIKAKNVSEVNTFLCFVDIAEDPTLSFMAISLLISCVFLLATFLVYLFSPRSQNLYGKSLMCYVASLFSAYLCLAIIQLNSNGIVRAACIFLGYSVLLSFLAAFCWLNIMSIDIWKTFRSVRLARLNNSSEERIQFLWYSLYAWTVPIVITAICAATDFIPDLVPLTFRPNIGHHTCWFSRYSVTLYIYFIIPISLIIICNTILYVSTAWRCWKIKSEIIRMGNQSRKSYAANKTQLAINGKLFIVMGVVWGLEIASSFSDHPIWLITDVANALHGVFIFVIFVLKKKVLAGLPRGIKKPFIRMRNIKKKSADGTEEFDDTNASKKFSRSSSTNVTDVSI